MRRLLFASFVAVTAALSLACSGKSSAGFGPDSDGGGNGNGGDGGGHPLGDGASSGGEGGGTTVSTIYAHTDTELYTMDPSTLKVTDIGPFQSASPLGGAVTDLAVNALGEVFVNTETAVYHAAVPASGPVNLTLVTTIANQMGQYFYALGFAPAGVLGSGEGLVAGDNNGELWYIDTSSSSSTPQDLGGFGMDPNGNTWELSGDVVFYTQNGAPTGLATIRSCGSSCNATNDSLAAIDMAALAQAYASKTAAPTLLKGTYGAGTSYGDLFGLGAWGDKAYGFARAHSGMPAQLVAIDGTTGAGTSLQTFANITKGWSGAGVTTKAVINVPGPTK
jgi:hypothetical protein